MAHHTNILSLTNQAASDVTLRPLRRDDLPGAYAISAAFGWPHRVEDWDFMFGLGQGIAAESAGKLLGTALFWTYEPNASALGLVGVAPEAQGRGLGRRLVEQVVAQPARTQHRAVRD